MAKQAKVNQNKAMRLVVATDATTRPDPKLNAVPCFSLAATMHAFTPV